MLKHQTFGPWFQTTRCWQQTNCCDAYATVVCQFCRVFCMCPVPLTRSSLTEKKIIKIVIKCRTYRRLLGVCSVLLVQYYFCPSLATDQKINNIYKIQNILLSVNSTGFLHMSDNLEPSLAINYNIYTAVTKFCRVQRMSDTVHQLL